MFILYIKVNYNGGHIASRYIILELRQYQQNNEKESYTFEDEEYQATLGSFYFIRTTSANWSFSDFLV